ncbi:hypothetical protein D6C84_00299 [Aureobasidium pullulans]|uniref:Uncharacterized protein n=1 Tax=Aureobasidium pullulans TaxID=5580 RepID=A0A4S9RZD4_AURPU|nr:hypothetical protein D6D26_02369 [Aureobasidium pullulans]THW19451.1 hypothetical protein D6D24_02851 [Aureobasidium pullulans]THW26858.1 hypothetical protein D6D25_06470 [Aureobasidium pullulans]THW53542.1 hypothetical protein D6D21_00248 [Aureobasidium pullulans]THW95559.1 hypothetical protein D6D15_01301 [Aureobasidium pullulans]
MADGIHSTGRGGAGNIGRDDTIYTDGSIVREGFVGESSKPEYSSGAGNIVDSPRVKPVGDKTSASEDVIPEPAMRNSAGYDNFHTGRGGEGNVYKEKYGGHSNPQDKEKEKQGEKETLGDKVKHLFGKKE